MCGCDGGAWLCFWAGVECLVWCLVASGTVGSLCVVAGDDVVELLLEFADGVCWGLLGEGFFEGLVEAFDFAAGLWVVGPGVFVDDGVVG